MPNIDETIEWVAQHHYKCSAPGVDDYCENCGSNWPCVPDRLAKEVERLRALGDPLDTLRNFFGDMTIKMPIGRAIGEIERLRAYEKIAAIVRQL